MRPSIGRYCQTESQPCCCKIIFLLHQPFIIKPSASCCKQDFPSPSISLSFFLPFFLFLYFFLHLSFCASGMQFTCSVVSYFLWHHGLVKLLSIELVMPSNHLILCRPLLLLTSIFPSIRVFSNESVLCIRLQKYWSFSFRINPFNEYSDLISLRIDYFDLLGTLKSLFRHHSSKASILWLSAFFIV